MGIQGDIKSSDLLNHIFLTFKIDTVIHCAAETHVDKSFGSSMNFTENNVIGTHTLLEMAKAFSSQIKRFIHVSTDEVYGESAMEETAKSVKSPLNPTNPYSATKAAAEFLVRSYRHSFKLPTIITRGNNVYGPKQYPEKIIPKFILLLSKDKQCPVYGTGTNLRSYLYISDVCNAFDLILHKGKVGEIYNIGTNVEISNNKVLENLLIMFGKDKEAHKYIHHVEDRAFNDFRYHINSTSLEKLGWKREVTFPAGLQKTKDWYLAHPNWWTNTDTVLVPHPRITNNTVFVKAETQHPKNTNDNESPQKKLKTTQ